MMRVMRVVIARLVGIDQLAVDRAEHRAVEQMKQRDHERHQTADSRPNRPDAGSGATVSMTTSQAIAAKVTPRSQDGPNR